MTEPQTITPERQIAASQVGQVFNSLQEYVTTLMHTNEAGQRLTSQPLEYARKAIEEGSFWLIKHVLMHGAPPPPKPAEAQAANANDTPVPVADVPTGADALPPTTPAESV